MEIISKIINSYELLLKQNNSANISFLNDLQTSLMRGRVQQISVFSVERDHKGRFHHYNSVVLYYPIQKNKSYVFTIDFPMALIEIIWSGSSINTWSRLQNSNKPNSISYS